MTVIMTAAPERITPGTLTGDEAMKAMGSFGQLLEAALSRRPAKNHDLLNGRRIDGRDYERVVGTHKSEAGATKRASRIRKRGFHVRVVKGHTRSGRECWGIYRHGSI